jgi:hypothetical protein
MKGIYDITSENFDTSFNIKHILENSAFYPASGKDGTHLKELSKKGIKSFIHVDYSEDKLSVKNSLMREFCGIGYRLLGIKEIVKNELSPSSFLPKGHFPLNEHEQNRIKNDGDIKAKFYGKNFSPFALWAVYELIPSSNNQDQSKSTRFSILHIGGEACFTFDEIYMSNKINPAAVVILHPGEGYGDNWTLFSNPEFRLYKMLRENAENQDQNMPKYVLKNGNGFKKSSVKFWNNYISEYTKYSSETSINKLKKVETKYRWIELFSFKH